jgi:hypothetical protein
VGHTKAVEDPPSLPKQVTNLIAQGMSAGDQGTSSPYQDETFAPFFTELQYKYFSQLLDILYLDV